MRNTVLFGLAWMLFCNGSTPLIAQESYRIPPEVVQRVIDAPRLPTLRPSPDGRVLLLAQPSGYPSISDLAQPVLRLAGIRLNPAANSRYSRFYYKTYTLRDVTSGRVISVQVPEDSRLSLPAWSANGKFLAFTNVTDDGTELWIADPATGGARAIAGVVLNGTMGEPCEWMPDSEWLLCTMILEDRGAEPEPPRVPLGPIVQRNSGRVSPVRTYQDLLRSPFDEELFEYYTTSQLALIEASSGQVNRIGEPGIFAQWDPAPAGTAILVRRIARPYSYLVPVYRFAQEIEVWTSAGHLIMTLASLPVADNIPVGGVRTGPRSVHWRPGEEASLVYTEALDGGDTRRPAEFRDRVALLAAPFTTPIELAKLTLRYAGARWGRSGLVLVTEYERSTRKTRTWAIDADDPTRGWRVIFDRSAEDRYSDPGAPLMTTDQAGNSVLLQSPNGRYIYLRGSGASPEGDRPFLDRFDVENRRARRLWRSGEDEYEAVVAVLDPEARVIVTRRESRQAPPNYLARELRSGAVAAITTLENPAPEFGLVKRQIIRYQRDDGIDLSGTLYYPTDYEEGEPVPVIFWIYPREFASANAAGQVRGSPNRFVLPRGASHLFLLTQGYAVLNNPTLPVIGGDTANNTYVEQTVAGAQAAVDYLMERGIANGSFGVGGHSYGAFATANLLAHSDLFKAGVARSGAYNRTLTPFGFQNERRTFWEARDVYLNMMPFTHANEINEPILLIHGMNDNNSGTFPIQSERMYHALKGHGATVEYVQLPLESHGYVARESVMDAVTRMIEWFDRYVKGEPPEAASES